MQTQTQLWPAILSLVGVLFGGGLSFLVQTTVQRRTERNDQRKQAAERSEARRVEQLELLREFIKAAQKAERTAEDRDDSSPAWKTTALDVLDELWVCERMIHVLFDDKLHGLARDYVRALDHVVWQDPAEGSLWDHLKAPKTAFLTEAREELKTAAP